jgi:CheY-like chemotaxis protein
MSYRPSEAQPLALRVLIVEDEEEAWALPMRELLEGQVARLPIEVTTVPDEHSARWALAADYFHLISMDMMIPGKARELAVQPGINVAKTAAKSGAVLSKLLVYSSLLGASPQQAGAALIHNDLPKLDRYAKSYFGAPAPEGIVELTPKAWAQRVARLLASEATAVDFGPGDRRLSVVGAWLEGAVKHLPPLLARHAQTLQNHWDDPEQCAQKVDAAIAFTEVCCRLALAQTQVLLGPDAPAAALPEQATMAACLDQLENLLRRHGAVLARYSWLNHVKRVLTQLDQARLLRNRIRHSVQPGSAQGNWRQVQGPLRAAMDLAAYWAQHPLWSGLRSGAEGWTGERLAGNGWPRPRRPVSEEAAPAVPPRQRAGLVWQTAVDVSVPAEPRWVWVDWQHWLTPDDEGRAWWLPIHGEYRSSRRGEVQLDLDGGGQRRHGRPG